MHGHFWPLLARFDRFCHRFCVRAGVEHGFGQGAGNIPAFDTEFAENYLKRTFGMTKVECNILDRGTEFPKDINGAATEVRTQRRRVGRPAARTA